MFDGVIDIHSHTLWGMDDGSRSFNETMDMCLVAEENGTSVLFVTPHLMYWDKAEELYDVRNERVEILRAELSECECSVDIKCGFEILCDDDIFSIKHFSPYTLNNSRYILIEFNFSRTTEEDVVAWCKYLMSFELVPIIAHPERYSFVKDDITVINRLSDMGVLFQINAGSLAGDFGEEEENISAEMLACGFVDFIGSDGHRAEGRNTDIASLVDDYPYDLDMEAFRKAAEDNPKCILNNEFYVPKRKKYLTKL